MCHEPTVEFRSSRSAEGLIKARVQTILTPFLFTVMVPPTPTSYAWICSVEWDAASGEWREQQESPSEAAA